MIFFYKHNLFQTLITSIYTFLIIDPHNLWHIMSFYTVFSYGIVEILMFGLVGFYGMATIVGYLMSNPLYTYILNIYDL